MPRSDSIWLTLRAGLKDISLQEHHCPYTIFHKFASPEHQTPQLITLIGEHSKTSAIRKMRFSPRVQGGIQEEIHLRGYQDSFKDDSPVLLADCELHVPAPVPKVETERLLGDVIRRPLSWQTRSRQIPDPQILAHMVYAKLIAPFSNVICIFAEDFGGLTAVAELLALWLMYLSNRPSDLPLAAHPRVLVLVNTVEHCTFDEDNASIRFITSLGREAERRNGVMTTEHTRSQRRTELNRLVAQQFGGIRVVAVPDANSSLRAWKSLKGRILHDSKEVQALRRQAYATFTVAHFKSFFQLASDHFCRDIISPFSFIKATRIANPVPTEFPSHLKAFLSKVTSTQLLNFAVPVIASSLALDSFPRGMHGFNPVLVFRNFFYQLCIDIDPQRQRQHKDTFPALASAIEVAFCQYSFELLNSVEDGVLIHQKVLAKFRSLWKELFSNTTCYTCLARRPENSLTCRHSLCNICTRLHGWTTDDEPNTFYINNCPLCGDPNTLAFPQKPDTAGVRALIAEGGGIRGIVPLTFLKELEKAIGLPMNIQEHFDIAFGSSSGAIIILDLFTKTTPIDECIKQFWKMSEYIFSSITLLGIPIASLTLPRGLINVLLSMATDGRYSSRGINTALKGNFSGDRTLFESPGGGCKVAVVATTTDDASTCIFTNYNGPEKRPVDSGYRLIRPADAQKELAVWEAARASSAAPTYFKSFMGYQDGGLGGHNNPINLALWEQDIIWSRDKKQPDIVLSLGTGFKKASEPVGGEGETSSFLGRRFVPRLFRSFMNFFVGETRWQELHNTLSPENRERYHRMNIEFYGKEPELDQVQAISGLQQQALSEASTNSNVQRCADNLLASLFYIELQCLPVFNRTVFFCRAVIRCRLGPSHKALRSLVTKLRDCGSRFYIDFEQSIPCVDSDVYSSVEKGGAFVREIAFRVMSLQDVIDVKLDGITRRARSISNCPYQIETMIKDEGLHYVFGSLRDRKRKMQQGECSIKRIRFRR